MQKDTTEKNNADSLSGTNKLKFVKQMIFKCLGYRLNNYVFTVTGKDRGKNAWHCLLVDLDRKEQFLEKSRTGSVGVADYGKSICSGWGDAVPEEVKDAHDKFLKRVYEDLLLKISKDKTDAKLYYALIDRSKAGDTFYEKYKSGTIEEIQSYITILHSGQDPPEVISEIIAQTFHFGGVIINGNVDLHAAAQNGLLLKVKEFSNAKGNGWTQLHNAAYYGNLEIIKHLMSVGADIHAKDAPCGRKPIHIAAREGHTNILNFFLSKDICVDETDNIGWTPLHYAAWKGNLHSIKFLINKKAKMNAEDAIFGVKPIHVAVKGGHTDVVEFLLNSGVDIDVGDRDGRTSFYYSAWKGCLKTAKFLESKGANIHVETKLGTKAVQVATDSNQEMLEYLLNKGINVNGKDKEGRTLLHRAVLNSNLDIVAFLVDKEADIDTVDNFDKTPLASAKECSKLEVFTYLANRMAKMFHQKLKYREALQTYEEVYETQKVKLGPDHSDTLNTHENMAEVLLSQGKCIEALKIYERVLERRQITLGSDHLDTLSTLHRKASVLDAQFKYNEALQIYEEVFEKRKLILSLDHHDTLIVRHDIAFVLLKQCKHNEALDVFTEVFKKRKDVLGLDHPDTLRTYQDMAVGLVNQGQYNEALKIFKEIFEKRKYILGSGHPDTLSASRHITTISQKLEKSQPQGEQGCSIQ